MKDFRFILRDSAQILLIRQFLLGHLKNRHPYINSVYKHTRISSNIFIHYILIVFETIVAMYKIGL